MKVSHGNQPWIAAVLGAAQLLAFSIFAQTPANPAATVPANALQPAVRTMPPLPPTMKSPVEFFRELMAAGFGERIRLLSNRPPASRSAILAKVHEYESMQADERELRLKATELQWWLMPLLTLQPTNRDEHLSRVPANDLKLVKDRLAQWDGLSAEEQKEFLADKEALNMIVEPNNDAPAPPFAKVKQAKVEAGTRRLEAMSEEQRQKALATYTSLFRIQDEEKERILRTLSPQEQRQIQRTLDAFGGLAGPRRAICVRSFEKFACLSSEEREQFLKNAERWELMSPTERQKWRDLVQKWTRVPPPLPRPTPPLPNMQPLHGPVLAFTNQAAKGN
ncbi:MAG TPA: DUF3106 domain-containing protein [Candidatus Binatia bacterium]|jgi:hypothetical protein|nr:DUF3106 domain-containing protein [Candidatus Binatia bacterium]